ncbi:serine hydrolase domain-containing protein [Pseudomonas eucalypticola]|uniref:Serine hydrolase n=1 Tax=Pseudomonas eucalypticola TaxID=2599595 RepID=A0A7D5H8A7_9PSED|nr:serine hydrolase [Pseudomonas eucalypticola]QKZ06629.1 serine hydrolase [Pseudomonas eucalypticola]
MIRRCLVLLLCWTTTTLAEDWPARQWLEDLQPPGPAVQALTDYAFAPRNDDTRQGIRTDALVVIRDGRLVYEHYAAPFTADSLHTTWSVSKSLMACVLGVAFGEGRFRLEDSAAQYYSPLARHPDIRLVDLLQWASGLAWQEDYEYAPLNSSVVAMLYTRGRTDMAAFTASLDSFAAPGQVFRYSSGDSNLLSAVLEQRVGARDYPDYPWRALFQPLGIEQAVWETDAHGTFVASSYAYLRARDLARVGLLMLRDGRWRDRQLLPAAWVAFNRRPFEHAVAAPGEATGGGQWWLNQPVGGAPRPWPDAPAQTFAALGRWGQALYVLPEQKLVIVRYGDDRDASYQHNELLKRALAAFAPGAAP